MSRQNGRVTRRRVPKHAPAPTHLLRSASWSGLREGDAVDVVDARERNGDWRFVAHVTNELTGEAWVEVVGGTKGERRVRSFRPEQLFPYRSARGRASRAPSLADAPGLPL